MTDAHFTGDQDDADAQIDELRNRIRTLVCDRGVLENYGASELERWANRQAIQHLQERLARLVTWQQQSRTVPPAA
jgi:hypothetical protein